MNVFVGLMFILLTIAVYIASKALYRRFPFPYMLPLLISTIVMIVFLITFQIPYETYAIGGRWLELLLGPAVVALAYPLYQQLSMLKRHFIPIIVSVTVGAIVGIVSGILLARVAGISEELMYSIVPKSVTTPVAMDIATTIGGIPPLAAVLVMVAGIGGVVIAPYLFKWCKVVHEIGKGIGTGSAAHAIGTAKALENSEKEGAASSVAMTLSAIIVSIIGPFIVFLFY
ncbi:LrgA-associated membrane protein LrgB [Halalkalibacter wakoensis JCM 9140]|uniref:LrgA-associated membrane protein LrgB n=1 Tax=Halalkalibacter wakoensis JCM 9140 TaxID=1236970 RepID=W4Q130_9BACI|nr:LrgB family protein [Halalkalibacter wakoensis]GAE25786.1 LrgA-associated membrane protein LrgB [Halalkalibacter wakoensis JCM 9140]